MSEIKVVLWDIDGTLLDFRGAEKHAIQTTFAEFSYGECTLEMVKEYSGINGRYWHDLENGKLTKQQVLLGRFQEFFSRYGIPTDQVEAFNGAYQIHLGDEIYFFPEAMEILQALKAAGYVQCAVTNGTKVAQTRKLSRSGMDKVFDHVFISEDVGYEKPDGRFFQRVFQQIGQYPGNQVLVVGDSLNADMRGGKNAGLQTCWHNPFGQVKDVEVELDYEIKQLSQVLAIVNK